VIAAVIEDAFQFDHPDLADNVVTGQSHDYAEDKDSFASPEEHATQVAGVLAARADNGLGGRGVAAHIGIISLNPYTRLDTDSPLAEQATFRTYFGQAWGEGREAQAVDVFNNSLGLASAMVYRDVSRQELAQWENIMQSSRRGLGGVYVWAGGKISGGRGPPMAKMMATTRR
jgi:subtilisin family serine protease